jgi:hypothetical protein
MRSRSRSSSPGGSRYDAPPVILTTLRGERYAQKQRDRLSGADEKRKISKVTLPKFSWSDKDD